MAQVLKDGKKVFGGVRVFIDWDTYELIIKDKEAFQLKKRYGCTYAVKVLVHKALGAAEPKLPTVAMSLGGKKSREMAKAKREAAAKKKQGKLKLAQAPRKRGVK